MRTFPCCKSLLCVTTSLGNHTQQTSSSHLFNVNRKNKSRLWRMVERRNIWLTPPLPLFPSLQLITATLKTRKNTATRLQPDLVPPASQFWKFYEWKMSGFPKPHEFSPWFSWVHSGAAVWGVSRQTGPPNALHPHDNLIHENLIHDNLIHDKAWMPKEESSCKCE